jgi:hypothetical protein
MYFKGRNDMNLNKREKILINIFINLFIIFTYHIYIYNPKVNEIKNLKNIKEQEEYNKSIETTSKNEKAMLKNLNQESIINIISDIFSKSTKTNSIKFQEIEHTEKYKFVNIEIQVVGHINDILKSIQKIDNSRISIYIESIMLDSTKEYGLCTIYLRIYSL